LTEPEKRAKMLSGRKLVKGIGHNHPQSIWQKKNGQREEGRFCGKEDVERCLLPEMLWARPNAQTQRLGTLGGVDWRRERNSAKAAGGGNMVKGEECNK